MPPVIPCVCENGPRYIRTHHRASLKHRSGSGDCPAGSTRRTNNAHGLQASLRVSGCGATRGTVAGIEQIASRDGVDSGRAGSNCLAGLCCSPASPIVSRPERRHGLDVAINGNADAIVTHNTKHFREAAERFDLDVLTPAELLSKVRKRR